MEKGIKIKDKIMSKIMRKEEKNDVIYFCFYL